MSRDPRQVIKLHIQTERTTGLRQANNEYVFEVDKKANKHVIKAAVEKAFKVKVDDVRTLIVPGKTRRMGRYEGKTPTWKKAIVRLKKGESISMFENI
ncbi:MAG TPA: 50S ribosomal protein L23 [candidate division Zixibacteria bacterium]|nr:50S ribosomal protein L23 [candidate division Zixibacteria bacterium]MDD4918428.1 50S ribosomal protein L23 [candidate division Zixibacteria bacterium]MDM7973975.1 50S ribosomal protein L23 [candidate division Zixibacteria bacterium]HOD67495.1 50S ribosomal protein L23 [candidate division Zixibacteria bacterium]HPI33291.1 50S ribosomal protein L23 [candidate division Zixibacteria bacterium]